MYAVNLIVDDDVISQNTSTHNMHKTLVEAAKCVIPLMKSHHEDMDALRRSAHDRFLSASHDGLYQYSEPPTKTTVHTPVVTSHGRKIQAR